MTKKNIYLEYGGFNKVKDPELVEIAHRLGLRADDLRRYIQIIVKQEVAKFISGRKRKLTPDEEVERFIRGERKRPR